MGIIQNAINQMIGTAGIAARLSPGYETRQELHKLGKEEQLLNKQISSAELHGTQLHDPDALKNMENLQKRQVQIAQEKFQLDPTREGFQNIISKQQSYNKFNKIANILTQRQDQALSDIAQKSEAKQMQKRNFKDYLSKLETSLGGKVGDLPKDLQNLIAKQYSTGERKKLMDKMDKESKK